MADKTVSYVFKGNITDLQAKLVAAGHSVGKLGNDLTSADARSVKFRKGLTSVGDSALKMGMVAAAGLGAIVAVTANFDQAMSNVQAATHETAAGMDSLRDAAIEAGAKTAFSASEAAAGIENLAKAGVSTADILNGGLNGALDLAAAGQIGVGEAAEYTAKAMSQFGLSGDQATHVADLLAAASGKAVGEVGDFGQALNQAGLVAAQTGLSIEDTVGTLAAMAQAGLQGSDAGTALKASLQRLQNPLGQGAKAMKELGLNAYDANGNFVGITNVAQQLQDKLGGLNQAQRDAAMAQIFGSDAVRAATVLYKEGATGLQSWIDKTNDSGYAAETASIKLDNLKGDWEAFTGSLETALIGSGESAQGPLRDIVQGATDAVNAFSGLPPAVQTSATALLGLTAAGGGTVWGISKIINTAADARLALTNLGVAADGSKTRLGRMSGALMGPWGLAIGAGITAIGLFAKHQADAAADVDALTATLDRQTGGLTENTRVWAVKKLMDSGALESARELGLSLSTVTDAALGNKDAIKLVNDQLEHLTSQSTVVTLDDGTQSINFQAKAAKDLEKILGATSGTLAKSRHQFMLQTEAMGDAADAADEAKKSQLRAAAGIVETAKAASLSNSSIRDMIAQYKLTPKEIKTLVKADTGQAERDILRLQAMKVPDKVFSIFTNHVDTFTRHGAKPVFATGGHVSGPGTATSDSIPAYLSNGEYVVRAAAVQKYGTHLFDSINAMRLASGGPVGYATGGPVRSVDDRLAIAQVLQQIRDLKQSLRADGDNKLGPLNRKVAELQLQVAQKELQLAKTREEREAREAAKETRQGVRAAAGALSFDSVLPAKPETVVGGVTAEIAEFKRGIREAGGVWTTGLTKWAATMLDRAKNLDATKAKLVAEEKARDALVETLGKQQAALDQLTSTMVAYSASVAGNFLKDPFNGSYTTTTPGSVDPGLASNLSSAEQQLIAIRNSATGDSVASAAMASKLIPQIAAMRAEVEKQSQPIERTVDSLTALRETLEAGAAGATSMLESLRALTANGLDPESAFFKQLAASGDVGTAAGLAALSPSQIDEYEKLFATRDTKAAEVGAYAVQQVYGQQQAILQGQISNQNALILAANASITALNTKVTTLGTRVENGAARGTELGLASLQTQLDSIKAAISSIPRETAENKKKARV